MNGINYLAKQFQKARVVGVPMVAIETPDQEATIAAIVEVLKGGAAAAWDVMRGLLPCNTAGGNVLGVLGDADTIKMRSLNLAEMLAMVWQVDDMVVFIRNAHRFTDREDVAQALCNLRDRFKGHGSVAVLLAPTFRLPAELERDMVVIEEPLPDDKQLTEIVKGVLTDSGRDGNAAGAYVPALRGLAAFPAEQAAALALTSYGIDRADLWDRKRKMIEAGGGLKVARNSVVFDEIGGIENAKTFGRAIFKGKASPSCIVLVDEIEKFLGGASGEVGDSSGVAQDALGVLLRAMEDNKWTGQIAVGPPGCAKTLYAHALGASHDVPTIALDLGAAKGSLVGQSEGRIRGIVKTLQAVAGEGAYWVATCNRLEVLPPELRRRFRFGLWYFDLPDAQERAAIWALHMRRFDLSDDQTREKPDDHGWTGADIRNVCEIAWRLNVSLVAAAQFITPVSKSDPDSIDRLRRVADGRFLSASYPGVYRRDRERADDEGGTKKRKIQLEK